MFDNRGALPHPALWKPGVCHCPLLLSDTPPLKEVAIHRAVASADGMHLVIPIRTEENLWQTLLIDYHTQSRYFTKPVSAVSDITPAGEQDIAWLSMDDEGWRAVRHGIDASPVVEFAWNLTASQSGDLAFESQSDRVYTPFASGDFWESGYQSTVGLTLAGKVTASAAVVQTIPIAEGDLETFASGCFTLATQEGPWKSRFIGAYNAVLSDNAETLAADVRLPDNRCSIAVNDTCWNHSWSEVWAPAIDPIQQRVYAPVKSQGRWWLFCEGEKIWDTSMLQFWELAVSHNGKRVAGVVSPSFGSWTLALDDTPWKSRVDGFLEKPVFSPCDSRLATVGRHRNRSVVLIDDKMIDHHFLQAWHPCFSPHGSHVAFKVRTASGFQVYLDGKTIGDPMDWTASPRFSPDGRSLLVSGIRKSSSGLHGYRTVVATE